MIGQTLSHFKITAKLGEGGMGEVWRAEDTDLDREVAIKVLPQAFTEEPERLARFEREAKLLASLNHPNIAGIYEVGHATPAETETPIHFLAMELADGEDLAERLERGAIPLEECLEVARQITEALEEAHEKGIIHRDLKPQNIKLAADGKVKVLDFGLAKALDPTAGALGSSPELTHSPTMTLGATVQGVILGTAAYMSPEQANGQRADKRSDIWAFGIVLFEMLSGRRLFSGDTVAETLASVLKTDIDLSTLPAATPAAIRRLLRRCLERKPKSRLHDIADARIVIDEALAGGVEEPGEIASSPVSRANRLVPWIVAAAALALLVASQLLRSPDAAVPERSRFLEISLPDDASLASLAPPVISPDGRWIAFGTAEGGAGVLGGPGRLWLRSLESFETVALPETDGGIFPFWSPDSRHLGFFMGDELRRLDLATRTPQVICRCAPWGRGASWAEDGTILFAPSANAAIHAVSASGGTPVAVTEVDEELPDGSHRFPALLPDGRHFLYTVWSNNREALAAEGGIFVASRDGGEPRRLVSDGSQGVFFPPDRLLLHRNGKLVAIPLDPSTLEVGTEAVPVSPVVQFTQNAGVLAASATRSGDLLFALGQNVVERELDLVWLDRQGSATSAFERPVAMYDELDISPDGHRFAILVPPPRTGSDDIWVGEFSRGTLTRLTHGANDSLSVRWSPDGSWLAYSNQDSGNTDLYRKRADGAGDREMIFDGSELDPWVNDWSAEGELLFSTVGKVERGRSQVWALDLESGESRALLAHDSVDFTRSRLSPDRRWLAFVSNDSGVEQVHVRPYPSLDRDWQISGERGTEPHWRSDGREIVFRRGGGQIMAVALSPEEDDLGPDRPRLLFSSARPIFAFAPNADHSRFLSSTLPSDYRERPLRLILNASPIVRGSEDSR